MRATNSDDAGDRQARPDLRRLLAPALTQIGDDPAAVVLRLAALRTALGVGAILLPGPTGRAWIGRGAAGRDRAVLGRALGGRDVALGAGALVAAQDGAGRPLAVWAAMGAVADAVDAVGTLVGFPALPRWRRWLVFLVSGAAAAIGGTAAAQLARRAQGGPGA